MKKLKFLVPWVALLSCSQDSKFSKNSDVRGDFPVTREVDLGLVIVITSPVTPADSVLLVAQPGVVYQKFEYQKPEWRYIPTPEEIGMIPEYVDTVYLTMIHEKAKTPQHELMLTATRAKPLPYRKEFVGTVMLDVAEENQ